MKRLFKFPSVDNPSLFVHQALKFLKEDNRSTNNTSPIPTTGRPPTPNPNPQAPTKAAHSTHHNTSSTTKIATALQNSVPAGTKALNNLTTSISHLWNMNQEDTRKQLEAANVEIVRLRTRQQHMSQRIERIVYSLLKELSEGGAETPEPAMDAVLVAIAELKQVKDVLSGLLPDESPTGLPTSPHRR